VGPAIWVARELYDECLAWQRIEEKGAGWITVKEDFLKELSDNGFTIPAKIQGVPAFVAELEGNPKLMKYLYDKFCKLVYGNESE